MNKDQKPTIVATASYLAMRDALSAPGGSKPVLPKAVVDFGLGRDVDDEAAVRRALGENLALRRLYRTAVEQQRVAYSPVQACAQDRGEVTRRSGDRFELRFRRSRASDGQVYVTLEVAPGLQLEEGEGVVIHAIGESEVLRVSFPPLHDGKTQRLFEADDAVLRLLCNDRSELEVVKS
ncbi:hypothetical protein [Wenzhouxiangella sp. EGI_FJ10305]|uniref:hypothetical protein n=1 Tax=Wenzhouxiangella sp. EGI_FJ10305 TaxID=3243768 RepID=UPI0035D7D627